MPIPVMQQQYLTNIFNQLTTMATLVNKIKVQQNAPPPASDLNTIANCLAAVNATLTACNAAGKVSDAERHAMGDQFAAIAAELKK